MIQKHLATRLTAIILFGTTAIVQAKAEILSLDCTHPSNLECAPRIGIHVWIDTEKYTVTWQDFGWQNCKPPMAPPSMTPKWTSALITAPSISWSYSVQRGQSSEVHSYNIQRTAGILSMAIDRALIESYACTKGSTPLPDDQNTLFVPAVNH